MNICRLWFTGFFRKISIPSIVFSGIIFSGCGIQSRQDYSFTGNQQTVPFPKGLVYETEGFSFDDSLVIFTATDDLSDLIPVIQYEFMSMFNTMVIEVPDEDRAHYILRYDESMDEESYTLEVDDKIIATGGSYKAVAMATISLLHFVSGNKDGWSIPGVSIYDYPDLAFRGLMIDVARKKHSIEVLKQIVTLCRWYKINYLQLHLTDEDYFSFPSDAYPQLSTENFIFSKEELADLVRFADARGVELIPELDVPGHAGQFVENMPEVFGFKNQKLNRYTINMANDEIYKVLETLIGEIASVFKSSRFIHIGGDEANFSGMDEDDEVQAYLVNNELESIEALFWHFINNMNDIVKKRDRKTIVWEGFSEEGNNVVSKDITVMAWETMYQLPDKLLEGGYEIINVSWKPLYVVNNRKWSPETIYNWNVYQWQNWYPKAPSFNPIQIEPNEHVIGAAMASWDQPEYVEISSLRKRLPAMVERVWNINSHESSNDFMTVVNNLDEKLNRYFSPVALQEDGLRFPEINDGYRNEQVWFGDTLTLHMIVPENLSIKYSIDEPLSENSPIYSETLKIFDSGTIRYRAFSAQGIPVGNEILKYYELNPLEVHFQGKHLLTEEEYWDRLEPWRFPYSDSLTITITSKRHGNIRYHTDHEKNNEYVEYTDPITISEDVLITAGLFINDSLTGVLWRQQFIDRNEIGK